MEDHSEAGDGVKIGDEVGECGKYQGRNFGLGFFLTHIVVKAGGPHVDNPSDLAVADSYVHFQYYFGMHRETIRRLIGRGHNSSMAA